MKVWNRAFCKKVIEKSPVKNILDTEVMTWKQRELLLKIERT